MSLLSFLDSLILEKGLEEADDFVELLMFFASFSDLKVLTDLDLRSNS